MQALQKDDADNVVPLAPPDPANDARPILERGKKWRRVTVNRKTLGCALVAELIIIGAILVVNWSLAEQGNPGEPVLFGKSAFWLSAMAGALAMATCELVRAGLVYLGAVHRRRTVRALLLFGAVLSVLVTTKSMSIVYEQLFASRLREVVAATMDLDKARAAKATLEERRKGPSEDDAERKARLSRLDAELDGLRKTLKQFETPPKPVTRVEKIFDRHGRVTGERTRVITPPWSGATMQAQYVKAQAERDKLAAELGRGAAGLRDIDIEIARAEEVVTAANNRLMARIAVSQMHSYAAMVFLKSPHAVTDEEVHVVMFVFVLLAAFATSVAASLAVYGSFTRFAAHDEPRRHEAAPNAVVITPTLQSWMERLAARGDSSAAALRA
jgi:hypothetical protein